MSRHASFSIGDTHLVCGGLYTKDCYMLNVSSMEWEHHSTLNSKRYGASVLVIGARVWVVGGSGDSRKTSEYLTDGRWTVGPSVPGGGVGDSCMTYLNTSHIILMGGWNQTELVSIDTVNTSCASVPLPIGMSRHASFSIGDTHLVCGGLYTKDCYMLNVSSMEWEHHSTLNSKRYGASVLVIGARVWVVGGSGDSRKTSEYLTDGRWTVGPSVPGGGVYDSCMTYLNSSHVILIGGYHDRRQVRLWDITTETWTDWTDRVSLPYPVWGHDCVSIEEGVLVTGGYNRDSGVTYSQSWIIDRTGQIEMVGNMTVSRWGHRMVSLGGKILSLGGREAWNGMYHTSIDEWVPGTNTWVRSQYTLTVGRAGFGVMVIPGPITTLCV